MFGKVLETPRREDDTPSTPAVPYAVAKVYGHWQTVNYREAYDLFACAASSSTTRAHAAGRVRHPQDHPRRHADQGRAAGQAGHGQPRRQARLGLCRRLRPGHVADAPAGEPDDFVVATGETHSVRRVPRARLLAAGHGYYRDFVEFDARYMRRPRSTCSWATRPRPAVLGWKAEVDFPSLVEMMVEHDLAIESRPDRRDSDRR